MFVHEDARRVVIDWANGSFKSAKAVVVKDSRVPIGCHYHRNKDERFMLLQGFADRVIIGGQRWEGVASPCVWDVPRGSYHEFHLQAGSILLGVASEEFDEADEIKVEP